MIGPAGWRSLALGPLLVALLALAAGLANRAEATEPGELLETSVGLSCQPSPVSLHHPAACTVLVFNLTSGVPVRPQGVVEFFVGGDHFPLTSCFLGPTGSSTLSSCQVTYSPASYGSGTHRIEAFYPGNADFQSSSDQFALVLKDPTTTSIACDPTVEVAGSLATCTVTVVDTAPKPPLQPNPTGTVELESSDSTAEFPLTCSVAPDGAGKGSCQFHYRPLEGGSENTVVASYAGGEKDEASKGDFRFQAPPQGSSRTQQSVAPLTPPPNTFLQKNPRPKSRTAKRAARFAFRSFPPGSTFQCKVDKLNFKACRSPLTVKRLQKGPHAFAVRAVGPGGVDPTPAIFRWTIR